MNNLNAYIHWRGDLSFTQFPLCPVDFLILAEIVHAPLENCPNPGGRTLGELKDIVWPRKPDAKDSSLLRERYAIWESMGSRRRFAGVRLRRFVSRFEEAYDKQFAAAVFDVDGIGVIAYRGTDSTVTGWKEDFNLAFEKPVPAQTEAAAFLLNAAESYPVLYLCGHSKGGNLAVYAASVCPDEVQQKILLCFDFDGPGMSEAITESAGYNRLLPKIRSYIPESSVIGQLLEKEAPRTVIRSDSVSILQHNPFFWHVEGPDFVLADNTTLSSRVISKAQYSFLKECTESQRRALVDFLCDILDASEAKKLGDVPRGLMLHPDRLYTVLNSRTAEEKKLLGSLLRTITASGTAGVQDTVSQMISRLISLLPV